MTAESLRVEVAEQARAVAAAWSPAGAPASWWLTAETFTAIAEEPVLLDLAVEVPTERLPPLLLSAAITRLVTELRPEPLAGYYPRPGGPQPPRDDRFRPALCAFATAEREALRRLCAEHRYWDAGQYAALQGGGEGPRQGPSRALAGTVLLLDVLPHDRKRSDADRPGGVRP